MADDYGKRALARRTRQQLRARRLALTSSGGDAGFSMVELVVTMVIIGGVLLGLMAVQTNALVTTGQAKQRQQATAYANQVMEQLRGLPWATLSKGMHTDFVVASGGDPNVASGRLRPVRADALDEALVVAAPTSQQLTDAPPLSGAGGTNLTTFTDPAQPAFSFTARAYVSAKDADTSGVVQLTVVVDWRKLREPAGSTSQVVVRSQAYSPKGGCGSTSTQPFLGACQAFMQADAAVNGMVTTVQSARLADGSIPSAGEVVLPGSTTNAATVASVKASATVVSSQVSEVGATVAYGDSSAVATATSDVGSTTGAPPHGTMSATSALSPATVTGTSSSLVLTPPTGQGVVAQASADTTVCPGPTPVGQPCADARVVGGTGSKVSLSTAGQTVPLIAEGSGGAWFSRVTRHLTAPGSTPSGCVTMSGSGCVAAQAQRSLGTITVGGLPWNTWKNPAGVSVAWGGTAATGLVEVTGYSDASLAEYGPLSLAKPETVSRTGLLRYWENGSYKSTPITPALDGSYATDEVTWSSGTSTVTAKALITVRPYSAVRTNVDGTCKADNCSLDVDVSSLTILTTYTLRDATGLTSSFTVTSDVGSIRSATSYKAAPNA